MSAVASAVLAAPALALLELPWARASVALLGAAVLLPLALAVALVVELVLRLAERSRLGAPNGAARGLCVLAGVSVVGVAGVYLSNTLLVAPPTAGPTLVGYALTVSACLGCAAGLRCALGRPAWTRRLRALGARRVVGALAAAGAAVVALVDASTFPYFYRKIHLAAGGAALVGLVVAARAFASPGRRERLHVFGLSAALWSLAAGASLGASPGAMADAIVRTPTIHRRAWLITRAAVTGEYGIPLPAAAGCLEPAAPPSDEARAPSLGVSTPDLVVLITMDAFRCGFGEADRRELRDVCPHLTELLASSRHRLDAHAASPSTLLSTQGMQTHRGVPIGETLRAAGYRTTVVAAHDRILDVPGVRASFDEVDETLVPTAKTGTTTTSEATTERALAAVRSMPRRGGKNYLWVHYFDPHAPYVEDPGSPWNAPPLRAYTAEVRRTDAAVARLVHGIDAELGGGQAVVIITADHGEEFGEHGGRYHGRALYEESTRIPILVKTLGSAAGALPSDLPAGSAELGEYQLAVALGRPFTSADEAHLSVTIDDDVQVGLVRDGWKLIEHRTLGYVELYNLDEDPGERRDVAAREPETLRQLRCKLAALPDAGSHASAPRGPREPGSPRALGSPVPADPKRSAVIVVGSPP